MDPEYLVRHFGHDLIFFRGIDIQELMPQVSPQKSKDEVTRRIEIFGKYRGYICAPAHNIQSDTPVENVLAFFDAVMQFRY